MAVLGEEARKLHLQGKKRMGLVKEEGCQRYLESQVRSTPFSRMPVLEGLDYTDHGRAKQERAPRNRGALGGDDNALQIVVQDELVRVGPKPDRVHFFRPLVPEPGLDDVLGEDVALQEELVIPLERIERLA